MKLLSKKLLAIAGILAATGLNAQTIVGSAHDFSTETWNNSVGQQICIVCHTPHNASSTVTDAPLWNHQLSTSTFTVYSTATLNATMGQPDASSKLCLSCHDGTVALENFGSTTSGTHFIGSVYNVGTGLNNDHPISFTYDATLATTDGELKNPATATSGLGSTIDADMLINHKLQCASCHDVHNTSGQAKLLIKSNNISALCLTCHVK